MRLAAAARRRAARLVPLAEREGVQDACVCVLEVGEVPVEQLPLLGGDANSLLLLRDGRGRAGASGDDRARFNSAHKQHAALNSVMSGQAECAWSRCVTRWKGRTESSSIARPRERASAAVPAKRTESGGLTKALARGRVPEETTSPSVSANW